MQYRPQRFEVLPAIVKNLMLINVLVFFATIVLGQQGIDLSEYLGLHHWDSGKFRIWQPLSSMFMHGDVGGEKPDYEAGFMHLFSNMFALWMFGSVLEQYLSPKKFLFFYLICGLGAAALHLGVLTYEFNIAHSYLIDFKENPTFKQFSVYLSQNGYDGSTNLGTYLLDFKNKWAEDPMSDSYQRKAASIMQEIYQLKISQVTVGASGAVFGILFAFGFLFPESVILLGFFIPLKAKYFVALYALFELYAGIQNSAGDNVAHFAHLGGMIFGWILLKWWGYKFTKNAL